MFRRTMPKVLIFSVAAVAAVFAGTAWAGQVGQAAPAAGTVSVDGGSVSFRAGDNAANDVEVFTTQDEVFAMTDNGAPIRLASSARDRCELDDGFVRCTGISSVTVDLGDRSDKLQAEGFARLQAFGQSGNDRMAVTFYTRGVTLRGGSGNDTLIGGDGDDRLDAGSGRNQRAEGNAGRDFCSGSDVTKVSCEG